LDWNRDHDCCLGYCQVYWSSIRFLGSVLKKSSTTAEKFKIGIYRAG
jgi:hypothetical protein